MGESLEPPLHLSSSPGKEHIENLLYVKYIKHTRSFIAYVFMIFTCMLVHMNVKRF